MKNKLFKQLSVIVALLILCFNQALAKELIKMTALQQKNLSIKTVALQASKTAFGQSYPGQVIVPATQIRVMSSAYAGLVQQLNVTTGQVVKKGQALGIVTSPELVSMQRAYLQSSAQKRLAKQSLARDDALFKDGIIAEKRLQSTQNAHAETVAQMQEQRQLLKLSGLSDGAINQLEQSSHYQTNIALTAPISGTVLEQMVTQGQRVDALTPLLKIAQLNPLWVEVYVPLADIKKYRIQKGAHIAVKDLDATGTVIALLPNMRAQDQTAIVRAEVTLGTANLFPSQMVDVVIAADRNLKTASFTVPSSALVNHQSRIVVFVENSTGYEVREAEVLSTEGNMSAILGDFTGAEKVVTTGTAAVKASWLGMGGAEE